MEEDLTIDDIREILKKPRQIRGKDVRAIVSWIKKSYSKLTLKDLLKIIEIPQIYNKLKLLPGIGQALMVIKNRKITVFSFLSVFLIACVAILFIGSFFFNFHAGAPAYQGTLNAMENAECDGEEIPIEAINDLEAYNMPDGDCFGNNAGKSLFRFQEVQDQYN